MYNVLLTSAQLCSVASGAALINTGSATSATINAQPAVSNIEQLSASHDEFQRLCLPSNYALTATPFRTERQSLALLTDQIESAMASSVDEFIDFESPVVLHPDDQKLIERIMTGVILNDADPQIILTHQLDACSKQQLLDIALDYRQEQLLRHMAHERLLECDDKTVTDLNRTLLGDPDDLMVVPAIFTLCDRNASQALPDLLRCYLLRPWTRSTIECALKDSSDGAEILESIYYVISFSASRIDRIRADGVTDAQLNVLVGYEVDVIMGL